MLNEAGYSNTQVFYAEKAYDLRAFAKQKRYTMQQITAFEIHQNNPQRLEVEEFICGVFYRAYGARVKNFMPKLIALRDENGQLMAAFGMREAKTASLFLEQYLDYPIETVISQSLNQAIARADITEIGNLAVMNPHNAGILISHVIQHSINAGVQWCVATAHHTLQNGLIKGGCDVFPLYPVDPTRLSAEEQANWGSYYNYKPQVIAVRNRVD
jgi:Thermostable hemolysin